MITRLPSIYSGSSGILRASTRYSRLCRPFASIKTSRHPTQSFQTSFSTTPRATSDTSRPSDLRSQFTPPAESTPTIKPAPKRTLRPYIYAAFFLLVGVTVGQYARLVVAPPPPPPAGSREDQLMVEFLYKEGEKLPIVKALTNDPAWEWHDAYSDMPDKDRATRLTTGPLDGAKGIGGFQRIFYNKETKESVAVIWFGGAVSGWPGVVHGGLVATVMDEHLGRCAIRLFPSKTGVTANLELNYRKPILANSYYVIRTQPQMDTAKEHKAWINGVLETTGGKVCVDGKALFVVPKKYKTKTIDENF